MKGVVRVQPGTLKEHLRERIERRRRDRPDLELKPFRGYSNFQSACAAADGHVVAIAPTGSGKTEASWLWALGQVERGHARKVIILLPTMVTANSIHDRLCSFFSDHGHEVGLVHSTSDLVRQTTATGDDEADRADVRADHLSETHLFRPVTVGTVDQLLVPLFHAGRWAMKTMAAADSAIVIDEIHAYDPHTLGLIVLMIKRLAPLGARFMVMSATLPGALKSVVHAALTSPEAGAPGVTPVEDSDLLDSARNSWETADNPLSEWLFRTDEKGRPVPSPEFLDLWGRRNDRGEPLRILVVVNTVKRCQGLARALREFGFELVCYHSKFIFEDRRTKERRINDRPPRLLLATQVVEVSLDIDYDVLLTECAPIDALVQRAGRVNRTRRGSLGRVVVHPYEIGSEIVYGRPRGVLDATWESLSYPLRPPTERDLIAMVEEVYAGLAAGGQSGIRRHPGGGEECTEPTRRRPRRTQTPGGGRPTQDPQGRLPSNQRDPRVFQESRPLLSPPGPEAVRTQGARLVRPQTSGGDRRSAHLPDVLQPRVRGRTPRHSRTPRAGPRDLLKADNPCSSSSTPSAPASARRTACS